MPVRRGECACWNLRIPVKCIYVSFILGARNTVIMLRGKRLCWYRGQALAQFLELSRGSLTELVQAPTVVQPHFFYLHLPSSLHLPVRNRDMHYSRLSCTINSSSFWMSQNIYHQVFADTLHPIVKSSYLPQTRKPNLNILDKMSYISTHTLFLARRYYWWIFRIMSQHQLMEVLCEFDHALPSTKRLHSRKLRQCNVRLEICHLLNQETLKLNSLSEPMLGCPAVAICRVFYITVYSVKFLP